MKDWRIRQDPDLEATAATLYLLAHDDHLGETVGRRATGRDIVEVLMAGPMPADRRLPEDFPTDEDVEVAATAVYALDWGNHPAHMNDAVLNKAREQARAALLAVADARRTEEGSTNPVQTGTGLVDPPAEEE